MASSTLREERGPRWSQSAFSTCRVLLAASTLLQTLRLAGAQTQLPHHSIVSPPDVVTLANDWFLAGTAIPTTSKLVLSPGVPNRVGMVWSRTPLLTNDFEVTFKFTAQNAKDHTTKDSGFALWYVQENVTDKLYPVVQDHIHNQDEMTSNTWDIFTQAQGFNLLGHRGIFDGLGVVFCDSRADKPEPLVASILGDGKKAYALGTDFPPADATKFNYRSGQEVTVKIRVQPSGAKIEIVGSGIAASEVKGEFKSGGYVGLTVFGGQRGAVDPKERSDLVEVSSFEISNYDANSKGEEVAAPPPSPAPTNSAEKAAVMHGKLAESSSHKDHRAESDAIKELTNMVFKMVVETHPLQQELAAGVGVLAKRVEQMETTFRKLREELDRSTGHSLSTEFEAIKKELTSLSTVADSHTKDRHKQLNDLHTDIKSVHSKASEPNMVDHHLTKLTEVNKNTIDKLNEGSQNMFGVSVVAIIFVLVAGLALYNKFRMWEKKHVL